MNKEYNIKLHIRNNLILKKIENMGYKSVASFCRDYGLKDQKLNELISFKIPIFYKNGKINPFIENLLDIFQCALNDLYTSEQLKLDLKGKKTTLELNHSEIKSLYFPREFESMEDLTNFKRLPNILNEVLDTLTPRESKVIKKRFFEDKTLEEVAKDLGVTRERIRQTEAKALRKLRHPDRSEILEEYI